MYFNYLEASDGKQLWEYIIDSDLSANPIKTPKVFWYRHTQSKGWINNKINAKNWDWISRKHLPLKRVLTREELFAEVL